MIASVYYDIQAREIASLREQITQGIDIKAILDPSSSVFRFRRTLKRRVTERLERVVGFGREQVEDELRRQGIEG